MWQKLSASLILYFFAVVDPLPAFAQQTQPSSFPPPAQDYYWYGPWGHMWGVGYGWHFGWMIPMMMLFMAIIFAVVFFLARSFCGHGFHHWRPLSHMMDRSWGDPGYSALQILNERFVRGEIQKDE